MKHIGTIMLETERLILRRFTIEDDKSMLNNWAPNDEVTKFLHGQLIRTLKIVNGLLIIVLIIIQIYLFITGL